MFIDFSVIIIKLMLIKKGEIVQNKGFFEKIDNHFQKTWKYELMHLLSSFWLYILLKPLLSSINAG